MFIVEYGKKDVFKIQRQGFTSQEAAIDFASRWVNASDKNNNWADLAELKILVDEKVDQAAIDLRVEFTDGLVVDRESIEQLKIYEDASKASHEGHERHGSSDVTRHTSGQYIMSILVDVKDSSHDAVSAVLAAMEAVADGKDRTGGEAHVVGGTWHHVPTTAEELQEVDEQNDGILVQFALGKCSNCEREGQVIVFPWSSGSYCFTCSDL